MNYFFCLGGWAGGRIRFYETPEPQSPMASATTQTAERAVGIHQDVLWNITSALSPVGRFHELWHWVVPVGVQSQDSSSSQHRLLPAALMETMGNAPRIRGALILASSGEARLALAKWGPA